MTDASVSPEPSEASDPPPVRPVAPQPYECCDSGCDPCVFDTYAEALSDYKSALAAWKSHHPDR